MIVHACETIYKDITGCFREMMSSERKPNYDKDPLAPGPLDLGEHHYVETYAARYKDFSELERDETGYENFTCKRDREFAKEIKKHHGKQMDWDFSTTNLFFPCFTAPIPYINPSLDPYELEVSDNVKAREPDYLYQFTGEKNGTFIGFSDADHRRGSPKSKQTGKRTVSIDDSPNYVPVPKPLKGRSRGSLRSDAKLPRMQKGIPEEKSTTVSIESDEEKGFFTQTTQLTMFEMLDFLHVSPNAIDEELRHYETNMFSPEDYFATTWESDARSSRTPVAPAVGKSW